MSTSESLEYTYKCSICDLDYPDERLVRTHISLSSDSEHADINGVMSEAVVTVVDKDGSKIEDKTGSGTLKGESMDEDLPDDVFPPSMSEKQQAVARTAVRNHNVDSHKEIERRVNDIYDIDVSYAKVRNTLKDFYIVEDEQEEDGKETYADLTSKQRAIIDVMASKPDLSHPKQAKLVGVSPAYFYNIKDEFPTLIDTRSDELVKMPDPQWTEEQRAVVEQLALEDDCLEPDSKYTEIADSAGVGVDVVSTLIHGHKHALVEKVEDTTDTTQEANNASDGQIDSLSSGMSASPDYSSNETVERLEELRDEVRLYRELAEERLDIVPEDATSVGQYTVTKRIEKKLDKIIESH